MSQQAPGHGPPAARAAKIPRRARVESHILPGGTFLGSADAINGNRDRAPNSSATAHDGKASNGVSPKASGLALDDTIRRVQESWEASRASADIPSAGDASAEDVYSEMQRMKHLNRSSVGNSHLGKRSSSGVYEEVLERKRRAVGDRQDPLERQESSTGTPDNGDQDASRRRSAPTAGMVNGTSDDKPRDRPQVLRAVRSAPNKPLSPALRGAAEPKVPGVQKAPGVQILEKAPSGRNYKTIEDAEGKATSAMGALIPDGYEKHDDDDNPWVCPIRDCRKLFRHIIALGAHFGAKHRHCNLNDNGDGTLSAVGEFKTATGQAAAPRVVSRKPASGSEPPMPSPKLPSYRKPLSTGPDSSSSPADIEMPTTAASRRPSRVPPPPVDPLPTSPMPALTSDLGAYLRSILPQNFNFGAFSVSKEGPPMLQLTIKREATREWIQRMTALKNTGAVPRCVLAFLLFLTGVPAEDPCPSCVTSDSGEECIIVGPSFPSFALERFGGSCAVCYYRCNRWHQKNNCLLRATGAETPGARRGTSAFADTSMAWNSPELESEESEAVSLSGPENDVSPAEEPAMTNGTSALRPPAPEPHIGGSTRRGQGAAASGSLLNPGNLMPADVLEMEDWEIAPGTIRNTSDEPDNIAFSNAYLSSNAAVPIMGGVGFNVINLKPGSSHKFPAQQSLRLCSLATGKLSVKVEQEGGDAGFQIGPNGMFRVLPGAAASVRNRVYIDAVLHVTTVEM